MDYSITHILLTFSTAFFVVLLSTPSLIKVAILKRLFDEPKEDRKLHKRMIPTIGGVIIFAGTLFSFATWFPIRSIGESEFGNMLEAVEDFKYLTATLLILFFVGVKDDIIGTAPIKKLVAHVIVGMILVLMADIRIKGFHGIFGIGEIPYSASIFLSLFTYIVVVNAFNLIDGVDGLAAGIGFICASIFGVWFFLAGEYVYASLSFALSGSLLAFLIFNFSPAKIFMGDSGSLTIGLLVSVLAIRMIEHDVSESTAIIAEIPKPVFAMAVLVYPLVDTLRIFIYRSVKGLSPFSADRNHLHHNLLDIGLGHRATVIWLYFVNLLIITLAVILRKLNPTMLFIIIGGISFALAQIPFLIKNSRKLPMQKIIEEAESDEQDEEPEEKVKIRHL